MTDNKLLEMFITYKDGELGNRVPGKPHNVEYAFKGEPSSMKLSQIADEMSKDIINAFQGCAIATTKSIYGTSDRTRPFKVELKHDLNNSLMTRGEVDLKVLGTYTTRYDAISYEFSLADIINDSNEVVLYLTNPDGSFLRREGKLVRSSKRIKYASDLIDRYKKLAAELEEFERPRREADALAAEQRRLRYARNVDPETKFAELATLGVPYEGTDEFKYSLFYLATHASTISASVKEEYLQTFERLFHVDARNTASVHIVPWGKKNSTGTVAKYSCSLRVSLKKSQTPMPAYLQQYATGNTITDTPFIALLLTKYGFEFGKVDSQKMIQTLIDELGTEGVPAEYLNQPAAAPDTTDTTNDPVDSGEDINPFDIDFPPAE